MESERYALDEVNVSAQLPRDLDRTVSSRISNASTLYEFLNATRFTGIIRGTDITDRKGERIVTTYMGVFEDSRLTGISAAVHRISSEGVHELRIDGSLAMRETIVKMLLKPVSSLEVVRKDDIKHLVNGNRDSKVKEVPAATWEEAKKLAGQIIQAGRQGSGKRSAEKG